MHSSVSFVSYTCDERFSGSSRAASTQRSQDGLRRKLRVRFRTQFSRYREQVFIALRYKNLLLCILMLRKRTQCRPMLWRCANRASATTAISAQIYHKSTGRASSSNEYILPLAKLAVRLTTSGGKLAQRQSFPRTRGQGSRDSIATAREC